MLYHESTFLDSEEHLCEKTKHSTSKQAAQIAKKANASLLILGHYSTRYKSIELFKKEAEEVFPVVELADDGKVFWVKWLRCRLYHYKKHSFWVREDPA